MFALADVLNGALVVEQSAIGVADGPCILRNPDARAVLPVNFRLESRERIPFFQSPDELIAAARLYIELAGDVPHGGPQLQHRLVTVDPGEGRIDVDVSTVGCRLEDPFEGIFEDAAVPDFRRAECAGLISGADIGKIPAGKSARDGRDAVHKGMCPPHEIPIANLGWRERPQVLAHYRHRPYRLQLHSSAPGCPRNSA